MELDREEYCIVGECNNYGDKAHLVTRATLPKHLWDSPDYYIRLCRKHHSEQHTLGVDTFCTKYDLMSYLTNAREIYSCYNAGQD